MGARQKINVAAVNGCLIVAGLLGLVTQSWPAFGAALLVLLALAYHAGDIRPTGRHQGPDS